MKTDQLIIDGIEALGPEHAALEADCRAYGDICQKLETGGKQYLAAVSALHAIALGKAEGEIRAAVINVRFMQREQGLLAREASRHLAKIAAQNLAISERLAALISTQGEAE